MATSRYQRYLLRTGTTFAYGFGSAGADRTVQLGSLLSQIFGRRLDAIENGTPVTRTSFEDGVRYMEFTEAVNVSMRERRRVDIAEIA